MDTLQEENKDGAQEESGQFIWLAGAFVGGILLLMIIIIIGIILWRHLKKKKISADQIWAGPSPLAEGNIQEEGSSMNSSILGRSMSLSHISTSPVLSNEQQTVQEAPDMDGKVKHGNYEEEENKKKMTNISAINTPTVPTKNASTDQMSTQITENGLKEETFPPPPLELSQEFPMPPPPEEFHEETLKDQQPYPEINSYKSDENGTQEPLNLPSDTAALHITNHFDDQLLPPPPPDL